MGETRGSFATDHCSPPRRIVVSHSSTSLEARLGFPTTTPSNRLEKRLLSASSSVARCVQSGVRRPGFKLTVPQNSRQWVPFVKVVSLDRQPPPQHARACLHRFTHAGQQARGPTTNRLHLLPFNRAWLGTDFPPVLLPPVSSTWFRCRKSRRPRPKQQRSNADWLNTTRRRRRTRSSPSTTLRLNQTSKKRSTTSLSSPPRHPHRLLARPLVGATWSLVVPSVLPLKPRPHSAKVVPSDARSATLPAVLPSRS